MKRFKNVSDDQMKAAVVSCGLKIVPPGFHVANPTGIHNPKTGEVILDHNLDHPRMQCLIRTLESMEAEDKKAVEEIIRDSEVPPVHARKTDL